MEVEAMGWIRGRIWLRRPRPRGGVEKRYRVLFRLLPVVVGIGLALLVIQTVEAQAKPLIAIIAQEKTKNSVTAILNQAVENSLNGTGVRYDDFVTIQTDSRGAITALTTNPIPLNSLRTELLQYILEQVNLLDSAELGIPLGNLVGFSPISGRGPKLPVRVLSAAVPEAVFQNVFTSAGINQTLHQVMLHISVAVTLLLPGETLETVVEAQVCVAETVIVGQVPSAYLELPEWET